MSKQDVVTNRLENFQVNDLILIFVNTLHPKNNIKARKNHFFKWLVFEDIITNNPLNGITIIRGVVSKKKALSRKYP